MSTFDGHTYASGSPEELQAMPEQEWRRRAKAYRASLRRLSMTEPRREIKTLIREMGAWKNGDYSRRMEVRAETFGVGVGI